MMSNIKVFLPKFFVILLLVAFLFLFFSFITKTSVSASSGYTTNDGIIYKDGNPIQIHGVNWFGAETDAHVVHGLWSRNYKDMIQQIKNTGFNAVRVPYCPSTIRGTNVQSVNYGLNPDLANLNSQQVLDKVLLELNSQQLYILLDFHRIDCYQQSSLWYDGGYSEDNWLSDLKYLANRYKNLGYFMGMDLKNEPKSPATWGTGNVWTDWNTAAEKAGSQVLSVNPNVLVYVEGITDNPSCSSSTFGIFWGENLQPQNCTPISESAIPSDKLIFSPHVYGPDVYSQSYFYASDFPNNMPQVWNEHFGSLTNKGYTIVPGEWGGKYGNGGDQRDVTWQNSLVDYFKNKQICNSFYWSWNPNSTDTGGILMDDWNTVWSNKVSMLQSYFSSCNQRVNSNNNSNITVTPTQSLRVPTVNSTVTATPSITPTQTPTITPTAQLMSNNTYQNNSSSTRCNVKFYMRNKWDNGYTYDVTITNNTGKKIDNWTLTWTEPNGEKIDQLWSGKYWMSNNTQANIVNEYWNGSIDNNSSVLFGFNGSYQNNPVIPSNVTLNGMNCSTN